MRAVVATKTGPAAEVLTLREMPTPEPGAGEVRVRIATSGINPSDVKRRGAAPWGSPLEFPVVVPHSDGAGTIDAVGADVPAERVGERVWLRNAQWLRPFGTAADVCIVPAAFAHPLPPHVGFAEAASFGIPALTAYHAVALAEPAPGRTLLVQGGAGAVGFYATQFAKAAGATVIASVSSERKAEYARRAGADVTIDYRRDDRVARVADVTAGAGVDAVVEVDLAANAMEYPRLLAEYGTAVVYGSSGPQIAIPQAFIRRSTTLRFFIVYQLRPPEIAAAVAALDARLRSETLDHGEIRRFPFERVAEAHEAVEAGGIGNVVLEVG